MSSQKSTSEVIPTNTTNTKNTKKKKMFFLRAPSSSKEKLSIRKYES